ncbi:MAG: YciE/YciF ferroxidase family protein [Mucilaginibacter sp.]
MDIQNDHFLDKSALRDVFICQLSLLYAAKMHLIESLPALIAQAAFPKLRHALEEDFTDSQAQMASLREIFRLLNETARTEHCLAMNAIIEEAHGQVLFFDGKNYESDMSIIFYMGVIEHMQVGAGRMLNLIAGTQDYGSYAHLVEQTVDMSTDNANLFNLVAAEYVRKN